MTSYPKGLRMHRADGTDFAVEMRYVGCVDGMHHWQVCGAVYNPRHDHLTMEERLPEDCVVVINCELEFRGDDFERLEDDNQEENGHEGFY